MRIHDGVRDWGWGVLMNFHRNNDKTVLDVCLKCNRNSIGYATEKAEPAQPDTKEFEYKVVPVTFANLQRISRTMIKQIDTVQSQQLAGHVANVMLEFHKRYGDDIPQLDPIEHLGIRSDTLKSLIRVCEYCCIL